MLNGNIKIAVNEKQEVVLKGERDNKTLYELPLVDDYYEYDAESFLKNLMGQCMEELRNLSSDAEMIEAVEDELDNYGKYYIEKR